MALFRMLDQDGNSRYRGAVPSGLLLDVTNVAAVETVTVSPFIYSAPT